MHASDCIAPDGTTREENAAASVGTGSIRSAHALKQNCPMTPRCHIVAAAVASLAYATSVAGRDPVVGQPAPDFQVTTFDGKKLTLADFKDQVLVLNFWATWCAPCKEELPLLDRYYRIQQKRGLRVLAITTEDSVPLSQLKPLAAALTIPMVRTLKGPYRVLKGVPTNYVIDRHGILRYARAAAMTLDTMNEVLVPLLGDHSSHDPSPGAPNDEGQPGPEKSAQ